MPSTARTRLSGGEGSRTVPASGTRYVLATATGRTCPLSSGSVVYPPAGLGSYVSGASPQAASEIEPLALLLGVQSRLGSGHAPRRPADHVIRPSSGPTSRHRATPTPVPGFGRGQRHVRAQSDGSRSGGWLPLSAPHSTRERGPVKRAGTGPCMHCGTDGPAVQRRPL
jgi:hypothetical protein